MLAICFRKESEEGPVISNKEDAMKELGIEKQYLAQVAGGVTRNVKNLNQRPKTFNIFLYRFLYQNTLREISLRLSGKNLKNQVNKIIYVIIYFY